MQEILQRFPASQREHFYTALIIAAQGLGVVNVAFVTATGTIPLWLGVVNAVAAYLGVTTGNALAKANVSAPVSVAAVEPVVAEDGSTLARVLLTDGTQEHHVVVAAKPKRTRKTV